MVEETKAVDVKPAVYEDCKDHAGKQLKLFSAAKKVQGCEQCMTDQGIKETECIDAGILSKAKIDTWTRLHDDLNEIHRICGDVLAQPYLKKLFDEGLTLNLFEKMRIDNIQEAAEGLLTIFDLSFDTVKEHSDKSRIDLMLESEDKLKMYGENVNEWKRSFGGVIKQ